MFSLLSRVFCCPSQVPRGSELTDQEILAIKESWAKARHVDVGQKILSSLIDKKPKFADYYGIESTLDVSELHKSNSFILQARRIQNFLDTVVASLGICPDYAVYSMAHRVGQIHYYKGVNFGADNWLVFKKVTVDQIMCNQKNVRKISSASLFDSVGIFSREVLYFTPHDNEHGPHGSRGTVFLLSSVDAISISTIRCCLATVGWNKLMALLIREMKRGFLDEAQRNCHEDVKIS